MPVAKERDSHGNPWPGTVGIYFLLIGGISVWSIRRKKDSPSDYFLANRNLGWFVIGASILASNVGSEHIVGLAGTSAKSGLAMGHYELHSWIVLTLGWVCLILSNWSFLRQRTLPPRVGMGADVPPQGWRGDSGCRRRVCKGLSRPRGIVYAIASLPRSL